MMGPTVISVTILIAVLTSHADCQTTTSGPQLIVGTLSDNTANSPNLDTIFSPAAGTGGVSGNVNLADLLLGFPQPNPPTTPAPAPTPFPAPFGPQQILLSRLLMGGDGENEGGFRLLNSFGAAPNMQSSTLMNLLLRSGGDGENEGRMGFGTGFRGLTGLGGGLTGLGGGMTGFGGGGMPGFRSRFGGGESENEIGENEGGMLGPMLLNALLSGGATGQNTGGPTGQTGMGTAAGGIDWNLLGQLQALGLLTGET